MLNFIGIFLSEAKEFCWDKIEEIGGSLTALFVFTNISFASEIEWFIKLIGTAVAMFVGGFFSYLGKKKAESFLKICTLLVLAQLLNGCSLSYRINNQCRVYSECTIIDGKCRACIECTDKRIIDKISIRESR